jgi:hypothetical protein
LLAVAQAQKEVTHNEALTLLDALVAPAIDAGPQNDPPPAPLLGQVWLVGDVPTGAWIGAPGALALWTAGGWRFIAPRAGMSVTRLEDGLCLCFDGTMWSVPPAIGTPAGGAVVDTEARAAIGALISCLSAHGLLIAG